MLVSIVLPLLLLLRDIFWYPVQGGRGDYRKLIQAAWIYEYYHLHISKESPPSGLVLLCFHLFIFSRILCKNQMFWHSDISFRSYARSSSSISLHALRPLMFPLAVINPSFRAIVNQIRKLIRSHAPLSNSVAKTAPSNGFISRNGPLYPN